MSRDNHHTIVPLILILTKMFRKSISVDHTEMIVLSATIYNNTQTFSRSIYIGNNFLVINSNTISL